MCLFPNIEERSSSACKRLASSSSVSVGIDPILDSTSFANSSAFARSFFFFRCAAFLEIPSPAEAAALTSGFFDASTRLRIASISAISRSAASSEALRNAA